MPSRSESAIKNGYIVAPVTQSLEDAVYAGLIRRTQRTHGKYFGVQSHIKIARWYWRTHGKYFGVTMVTDGDTPNFDAAKIVYTDHRYCTIIFNTTQIWNMNIIIKIAQMAYLGISYKYDLYGYD